MKQKGLFTQSEPFFRWHLIAFIGLVLLIAYSLVAEITYPGNATVPFSVFRPIIIERLSLMLILGITVVIHFALRQSYALLQARIDQEVFKRVTGYEDEYQRLEINEDDSEAMQQFPGEKRKRHMP